MTTNSLTVFDFKSNHVRIISVNNEAWFVAKDICDALELADTSKVCSRLDEDEKLMRTLCVSGQNRDVLCISESGLYSLILTSRKPEAKAFKKWVTSEVLPTIRKTGSYSIDSFNVPQTFSEALLLAGKLQQEKEILETENKILESQNYELSEMVDELFDHSSIIRVAKFNGISETAFKWQRLKAVSLQMGIEIKKAPDPRFGTKNLYAHDVWRVAYPNYKLPETTTLVINR
jgi:prophage antirepressor-like protein